MEVNTVLGTILEPNDGSPSLLEHEAVRNIHSHKLGLRIKPKAKDDTY